jgi:hypothetical protein
MRQPELDNDKTDRVVIHTAWSIVQLHVPVHAVSDGESRAEYRGREQSMQYRVCRHESRGATGVTPKATIGSEENGTDVIPLGSLFGNLEAEMGQAKSLQSQMGHVVIQ